MSLQYIGARYVIKIYENKSDPSKAEWDANTAYEPLTMVTFEYNSYLSKKLVPATIGNPAANPEYWAQTGYYSGQVMELQNRATLLEEGLNKEISDRIIDVNTVRQLANSGIAESIARDDELNSKINGVISNLNSEITNRTNADNALSTSITNNANAISTETTNRTNADANLQTQINEIVAPSGEAPNPAEITNARIGTDGTVYDSLGEAIRTQIDDCNNNEKNNNDFINNNSKRIGEMTGVKVVYPLIVQGQYEATGFDVDSTHIRIKSTLPAGTYKFTPKNGAKFCGYYYNTDVTGTLYFNYRTTEFVGAAPTDPFYLTIRKGDDSAISPDEYSNYFEITQAETITNTSILNINKLTDRASVVSGDLDSIVELGWYCVVGASHVPARYGATRTVYLEVLNFNKSTGFVMQRVHDAQGDAIPSFVRFKYNNSAWSNWLQEGGALVNPSVITTTFDLDANVNLGSYIVTAFSGGPIPSTAAVIRNSGLANGWTFQELYIFNSQKKYYRVNRGSGNYGTWYNMYPTLVHNCVNFGDSIYGNNRGSDSISWKLAELTGWKVLNGGFGGCRMSKTAGGDYEKFSMVELANAIVADDYTAQETAATNIGSYFGETLTALEAMDWSTVDRITISYGTNDWSADVPIGVDTITDETTTTFKGALRYVLHKLCAAYPSAKISVCGLFNRFDVSDPDLPDGSEWENNNGDTVLDFCKAAEEVAKQYDVQYIDQFYIGMNKYSYVPYHYVGDGTHLNSLGCDIAAANLQKQLY